MARALFLIAVAPVMAFSSADAQTGGIQVAPVMVAMSSERSIASVRVRNGRARPIAFEVDVYAWSQSDGLDVLSPTRELLAAPGVFEIAAGGEQVVRLGVVTPNPDRELAYRIMLRELPPRERHGSGLGFALEMSLPVFVTPVGAEANVQTHVEQRAEGRVLVMRNTGNAHAQILSLEELDGEPAPTPRYLLAGASADVLLPHGARSLRLRASETAGALAERIVHVERPNRSARLR